MVAGLQAVLGPPPASRKVAVAARDLPAGRTLTSSDLSMRSLADASLPAGLVADPEGETLATPVRRGEPLTDVRLSDEALLESYPLLSAVPLRLPDRGAAALLAPGDRIDVWATDPQGTGARLLLDRAPVLAMPPDSDAQGQAGGPLEGRLVVLGVPPGLRQSVAEAAVRDFLSVSFSG